jgi:hypothetical protein
LRKGDEFIRAADHLLAQAIRIVSGLYADGLLPRPPGLAQAVPDLLALHAPPAPIERRLHQMHVEYRTRVFQGAFHANPEYSLAQGWQGLVRGLEEITAMAGELRRQAGGEHDSAARR